MTTTLAPPELHLPDLPEVEVSLGAPTPQLERRRRRRGLRLRWRELLGAYLPLVLMALLALGIVVGLETGLGVDVAGMRAAVQRLLAG